MGWSKELVNTINTIVYAGITVTLGVFIMGTLGTALANTSGGSIMQTILGAFENFVNTWFPLILVIAGITILVLIISKTGLVKFGKKE